MSKQNQYGDGKYSASLTKHLESLDTKHSIKSRFVHQAPCKGLADLIAYYELVFPSPLPLTRSLTILPNGCASIIGKFDTGKIIWSVIGPSVACTNGGIGDDPLLIIINCTLQGLPGLLGIEPRELTGKTILLKDISPSLTKQLEEIIYTACSRDEIPESLDTVFLNWRYCFLSDGVMPSPELSHLFAVIEKYRGGLPVNKLAAHSGGSARRMQRLFIHHTGISPKHYSRIVRVHHAAAVLKRSGKQNPSAGIMELGYFDQAHSIHDFKAVTGVTPSIFSTTLSDFYNTPIHF